MTCPQCSTTIATHDAPVAICGQCLTINVPGPGDTRRPPTLRELDGLLNDPQVQQAIVLARNTRYSTRRQTITDWCLTDPYGVLETESYLYVSAALNRTVQPPWAGLPWLIFDPGGRLAYHHTTR